MKYLPFLFLILVACNAEKKIDQRIQKHETQLKNTVFSLPKLPQSLVFAGEEVQLTDLDIRERLDREVLINAYMHSTTTQIFKRANRWFPVIEKILKEQGIPDDFKYLAVIESALVQAESPAGALGFWQFMPKTGKEFGLEITDNIDERLHVEKSTYAACQYLKNAKDTLKDWVSTCASYNRGIAGVKRDMQWQESDSYFDSYQNSETGRYVFRLLAFKLIFENAKAYGFDLENMEMYPPYKTKKIQLTETIPNLASWAKTNGTNFKIVKILNPWILGNKLIVKSKSYTLLLPTNETGLKPYK